MKLSVERAMANGTAFYINSEDCQSLNANQVSNSRDYSRLVQVVTIENQKTFFQIGDGAELSQTPPQWNNEIYIAPNGKTEIFILPANNMIVSNRQVALIVYE